MQDKQTNLFQCIGEPNRLQIIKLLAGGEKCVNEIVEALGKEQPLVSHHLKSLKHCGIVVSEPRAQKVYYKLSDPRIAELVLISDTLLRDLPLCVEPVHKKRRGQ
jgi:DNA-binding transcriptional ArsR family regulator